MVLKEYFEVVVALVAYVVWLVRLEGMTKQNREAISEVQKDVDQLRTKHEMLDSKIVEQLGAVRESLARLEGKLGIKNEDN